jgi:hypothetical protein
MTDHEITNQAKSVIRMRIDPDTHHNFKAECLRMRGTTMEEQGQILLDRWIFERRSDLHSNFRSECDRLGLSVDAEIEALIGQWLDEHSKD